MARRTSKPQARASAIEALPVAEPEPERVAIEQLAELELDMLTVLALASEALSRADWVALTKLHGEYEQLGSTSARFGDARERLLAAGLVDLRPIGYGRIASEGHEVRASVAMTALEIQATGGRAARNLRATALRRPTSGLNRYMGVHPVVELRLAMVGDPGALAELLTKSYVRDRGDLGQWIYLALGPTPRASWLERMPSVLVRAAYLACVLEEESDALRPLSPALLERALELDDKPLRLVVGRVLALRGEPTRARALTGLPKWGAEGLELLAKFWAGDYAAAYEIGEQSLARKRRPLTDLEGSCQLLATIVASASRPELIDSVGLQIQQSPQLRGHVGPAQIMGPVHRTLQGSDPVIYPLCSENQRQGEWLSAFVRLLHDVWLRPPARAGTTLDREAPARAARAIAQVWHERALAGGYAPIARELAGMIAVFDGQRAPACLASAFHPPAPWEAALASLEAALAQPESSEASVATRELVWELEVDERAREHDIKPRLRSGARAKKGQAVTLARLLAGEHDDLLTDADRRVLASVTTNSNPWERGYGRPALGPASVLALVGHPRVIGADGKPRVVERGRATIRTRLEQGLTKVELFPSRLREQAVVIDATSPDRIVVFERSRELEPLLAVLDRGQGLEVPEAGRERLALALTRMSVLASVEVEGDLQASAREHVADPRVVIQLGWNGAALVVRARVAPLGMAGPLLYPGAGASVLIADLRAGPERGLFRCSRDLDEEQRRCALVLDACPTLCSFAEGELQWRASSLHEALEIVLELDALADTITLAWQVGQKLDVPKLVDMSGLKIRVGAGKAWFNVEVGLAIDEHSVLQYRELLRGREGPRFVALPHGQFLALSDRLRRHLDRLASVGVEHGEGLRSAPALLPLLEELAAETEAPVFDAGTLARLDELRTIASFVPKLPRGFGATLRDYQREGFVWMARLAEAGLGACLADDMGLGKTVQALALLSHRSRGGPALVVCPTSVVNNWRAEAQRFAPNLRVVMLAEAGDRAAALAALGPRGVVIVSYALLVSEVEALAEIEFASAVFDEAHALKNSRTQRAQAARRINAGFRLALTGTPIENHLGELWSLFAAILPGMLGSEAAFEKRFIASRRDDRERVASLRTLLRPFVLRRLKSQVLDELPARTEITLRVEPYPEQLAYYEAMRQLALERTKKIGPKQARFQLLAEITRLRQAAVDPRLVDPELAPKGAKLDVLIARLLELRDEGHRALVFTQFLGSLAAVRERLLEEGIEHFELEGSTPASERARRIDAFQAGEADVFLLSLRAGGTGVNLTGADYVFHLDPWWNPAVEDQASDRAHRIGQERPVTIYRLVTEGTIEEKILALHGTKRQLADDLLAGLERSETLDLDQLRALLDA